MSGFEGAVGRASTAMRAPGENAPALFKDKDTGDYSYMGLPFRGPPPTLKEDDPYYQQPVLASEVHIKVFDLTKPDDLTEYTAISQEVADSKAQVSYEKIEYDAELRGWRVLIRWFDQFYRMAEQVPSAFGGDGNA